jgi:hypothetical protein
MQRLLVTLSEDCAIAEDGLRQLLCQNRFRDANGCSGNQPIEASCNREGTPAWTTFRPLAAMLMSW